MSKNVPYTWEQIEADVRKAVWVAVEAIGIFTTNEAYREMLGDSNADEDTFNIKRHRIYSIVERCYAYAYQLQGHDKVEEEDWYEAEMLLNGGLPVYTHNQESPLMASLDSPLRTVLETFFARYGMNVLGKPLNIRELGFLAGMSDSVVRASLSKEGFKLERSGSSDESAMLSSEEALRWLTKRRGFIPNRGEALDGQKKAIIEGLVFDQSMTFSEIISELSSRYSSDIFEFTQKMPDADKDWVLAFFKGDKPDIRLDLLKTIAKELDAPEAMFVGRAVTHLMS
ncbi:hypothetical protein A8A54_21170 [Brucella pseudogrignonensis]|uniref:hypothetical protein n=1 Tax=Brucella pseudogrignonensis TaxID=419475 RepID=UPI0002BC5F7A|nr:hypothetical protein [Brucella pseudogrignonensis]ANG99079.1 hypothetical protein A8A54_21170 [Brucella pseudogrignonensis]EMG51245.1 hypothetical protein WYI_23340 [Ochrobactrum sp. CDB2]